MSWVLFLFLKAEQCFFFSLPFLSHCQIWQLLWLVLFFNSSLFNGRASSIHGSSSLAASKWDRETRISLVVDLSTAALRFHCDIKLVIIAERGLLLTNDSLSMLPASKRRSRESGEVKENITGLTWFLGDLTWLFKEPVFLRERVLGICTNMHFVHRSAHFSSKLGSDCVR